ncbi:MAG: hypothetical protein K8S16_21735 [Bacteroidales bacterium]|nr:hypothetical protein [Bacteroidales bacterium]
MNDCYNQILKSFSSDKDIIKAIVSNNALIYYYTSQMVIYNSNTYRNIEIRKGKKTANRILTDSLIVFRRQVKYEKVGVMIKGKKIFINNISGPELSDYLITLFLLIFETGNLNPAHRQSEEFEKKLIDGKGFERLYELKNSILSSLRNFGCKQQQDQEDIFQESLLVFWKKIINGEFGIYFSGSKDNIENCQVYNCKYYQNSKLNTLLTGIARNLFLNRTRSAEYKTSSDLEPDIVLEKKYEIPEMENESPILLMFYYYRYFVEKRKIRALISILQHDCNLEEKEIRNILGVNNARIHSSRLKAHFYQWHEQNENKSQEIADQANEYFTKRESKNEKLNEKIRTIDLYHRNQVNHIDLDVYREEFKTLSEFTLYDLIFKQTFYFTSIGKYSVLTGLPDEELLRESMAAYKRELYQINNIRVIFFLLFYGSDEPDQIIIELVNDLYSELKGSGQCFNLTSKLTEQLNEFYSLDQSVLTNELYQTNSHLFDILSKENSFTKLTTQNEIL